MRINVISTDLLNQDWEFMTNVFVLSAGICDVTRWNQMFNGAAFLWKNFIYVIGGQDQVDNTDKQCIVTWDITNQTLSYWGDFPIDVSRHNTL